MTIFMNLLFLFLLVCAIAVSFTKNLLNSILVYMSFSLVMALIWMMLESPDLAITEAAVGAGVTTVLFLVTLKKLYSVRTGKDREIVPGQTASAPERDLTVQESVRTQEAEVQEPAGTQETAVKEPVRTQEAEVQEPVRSQEMTAGEGEEPNEHG